MNERVLLVCNELMFQSRLVEGSKALGYEVTVAEETASARGALKDGPLSLMVIDLQARGVSWQEVVGAAREANVPVLAYGQHTKANVLREAKAAGCAVVAPRSSLVEEMGALMTEAKASASRNVGEQE